MDVDAVILNGSYVTMKNVIRNIMNVWTTFGAILHLLKTLCSRMSTYIVPIIR